ncbi:MAG TPA: aminotransferase class V-fold PLP-dependent enzyme [Puia sp.]|nr:aminotransferase class V-fold PLP-dependent enzyme [Puia sp.]
MAAYNRRSFLDVLGAFSATTLLSAFTRPAWSRDLDKALLRAENRLPQELAGDEDFWYFVQQSFTVSPELINLNNGGVSPSPKVVVDTVKRYLDFSNEGPSYYMWRILDQGRELREGIRLVWVDVNLPSEDNEDLANQYIKAFTRKTKVVHATHVINWNGQIMPVRKIADAAHAYGHGIEVLVAPGEFDNYLFNEHRIHVTNINWEGVHGVRITPNVYTTTKNLDRLIAAIGDYAKA